MEESVYQVVDFGSIENNERVFSFGGNIMVGDNINQKVDIRYNSNVPFKTTCTIILLCVKGRASFCLNSMDYDMKKNDLLVASQGSLGQMKNASSDLELVFIAFGDDSYFSSMSPYLASQFYNQLSEYAMMTLDEGMITFFLDVYRMIKRDISDMNFQFKKEAINGYMQIVFAHSHQWYENYYNERKQNEKNNRSSQIYIEFVKNVSEFHNKERSVSFYAEKMCLTPKYLSQVVQNVSGKYATEIIRDQVISEAKVLLKSHKHSVQEIAYVLNFPNPSFFGKYFKAATGISPRQYMIQK